LDLESSTVNKSDIDAPTGNYEIERFVSLRVQ